MKRLTIHEIKEYVLANYFDGDENVDACVGGDEEITVMANIVKSLEKLAEYEDAEEKGLLIKLPCKVGDNLYFETYINNARENIGIQGHQIIRIDVNFICKDKVFPITIPLWEIGEYVFLTHDEAVSALEKMKGE